MGEILDLKDDTQIIFFTWKKVLSWEFFMFEPKQFLHHNKAGDLYFKMRYISTEVVV